MIEFGIGVIILILALILAYLAGRLAESNSSEFDFSAVCFIITAVIALIVGAVLTVDSCTTTEFPASEYALSIKTVTIDNQTDTTYILKKN